MSVYTHFYIYIVFIEVSIVIMHVVVMHRDVICFHTNTISPLEDEGNNHITFLLWRDVIFSAR